MPQIQTRVKTTKPESKFDESLEQELLSYSSKVSQLLNNGLRFEDNQDVQIKTYTTNGTANTEDTVAHTLKRVPIGFLVLNSNKSANLYDSGTAWTTMNIFLKADVTSATVKVMIF